MTGFGDLLGMMRDLGALRQRMAEIQAELARQTAEGQAGGGMVTATVNGRSELLALKIDPAAVDPKEVALLEEMVKGAVGQAMARARDLQREAAAKLVGGMPLPPGLLDMFT
ncbi:MAG: YbaB/EbfC family nucleoid-associated protein [Planctomycetes bacterium]|nr:YbaB/EbfC family nucleoid-associated protein [Planctomycetota bacterium]